jgi:hypothetical protein
MKSPKPFAVSFLAVLAALFLGACSETFKINSAINSLGQSTLSRSELPLVLISLDVRDQKGPVNSDTVYSIQLENLGTGETMEARKELTTTSFASAQNVMGSTNWGRFFMHASPGKYRIKKVTMNLGMNGLRNTSLSSTELLTRRYNGDPSGKNTLNTSTAYLKIENSGDSSMSFEVRDSCVNYIGGVRITIIKEMPESNAGAIATTMGQIEYRALGQYEVVDTSVQDARWAEESFPCLRSFEQNRTPIK